MMRGAALVWCTYCEEREPISTCVALLSGQINVSSLNWLLVNGISHYAAQASEIIFIYRRC